MTPNAPVQNKVSQHIIETYPALRKTVAVLGIALPVVVVILGWESVGGVANSISAYYDLGGDAARNYFVGSLIAIGALLIAYKGFKDAENRALNVAGVLACMVAMFPRGLLIHAISAITFFLLLAYVCWTQSKATLSLLPNENLRRRFAKVYGFLAVAMVALPVAAVLLHWQLGHLRRSIFTVEALGVWVFSAYWWVKSREISISHADELAAAGKLTANPPEPPVADAGQFNLIRDNPPAAALQHPARAGVRSKIFATPLRRID